MFYQLNKLSFHPVINADYLNNWGDLDGIVMHTHDGAGSGTEAIMNMMARRHNIQYSEMKYVPGSGVRANAMLQKRIKATIVDTERRNLLLNSRKGDFKVLPMPPIYATDEALYANQTFIESHRSELKILLEELLIV
jgi:NitT/TauT family transport system substrate-binding protein